MRVTSGSQSVHRLQPLKDPRWEQFLERHPRSSVFHTVPWLDALRRTYGYEPVVITTCPPGTDLQNAAVLCSIDSWLTGRRMVSLPFSDHCDLLVDSESDLAAIIGGLEQELTEQKLRYIEFRASRALDAGNLGVHSTSSFCLHTIDLRPGLDTLFCNCHKDSTQRKIRRAEREPLTYDEGRSGFIFESFYDLMVLTRRRHSIPPQPKKWFLNLIDCFQDSLKIRIALRDRKPIAAMLTLRHGDTLVYKYGCSNADFHHLGGIHLLFWRSIQEAKQDGLQVFDLGRSDLEATGLIRFKERWGAKRSEITYLRLLASRQAQGAYLPADADWKGRIAKQIVPHLPDRLLCAAGNLIYRHIG